MPEPKTLLQMAGAPRTLPDLADTALVIIDAQNEYRSGGLVLDGIEPAIERAASVLAAAREAGATVIHIAHKGAAGGLFDRDANNGAIIDELAPKGDEPVIEKGLPSAFTGTDLEDQLKAAGRSTVLIIGFMTHMCVSSTARAAAELGHRVAVVGDATATRPLPDAMGGEPIAAPQLHRTALAGISDRFATVLRADEIG